MDKNFAQGAGNPGNKFGWLLGLSGFLCLAAGAPAFAGLDDGLMAYYPFDGNANDASGNKNHGVLHGTSNGGPQLTADASGKANSAYRFDGVDDYISVPNAATLNPVDQMTIAFWMRIDGFTNVWSPIVHKGGPATDCDMNREYSVWLNSSSYMLGASAGDSDCQNVLNSNTISAQEWHQIVYVIDRHTNHNMQVFVDGALDQTVADPYRSFNTNNNELRIAWTEEAGYSPYQGALDELRLYNRALSAAEIQDLYNLSKTVSGSTNGLDSPLSVTCKNLTTGSKVKISTTTLSWDCEAKGLEVAPGDQIQINIKGTSNH